MPRPPSLPALVASLALSLVVALPAAAQDATPAPAAFAEELGLPELRVTVTDEAFEGLPAEVPAGRYLLSVEARATEGGAVDFLRLPDGMDLTGFEAVLAEGSAAEGPPEWYYQTAMTGGIGGSGEAVIDLTPGEWIAWADDPEAAQPPVAMTVTGDGGATPTAGETEPAADATVTMYEYDFTVEGELQPGPQVIAVANVGAQPHHMIVLRSPEAVTEEQVARFLELDMTGATPSPEEELPDPDALVPVVYVSTMSSGARAWVAANLEPGYYVLICFVPDLASGMPHAFEGMYQAFEVAGA
jgi:hypothetical protein